MSKQVYDHKSIEAKFKELWNKIDLHKTPSSPNKKYKKYVLDMFPYPSGKAMHVGHAEGYIGTDIVSRYYRLKGFDVLHPMGWDAFGLPAENFAIKTGVHPRPNTDKSIEMFKKQLDAIGLSYDWSREVGTHTPDYYKWTQWFFLLLYKKELAYKKKASVNWCENCKTVLANEQVIDGKCERCDGEVIQKDMEQWFFRITEYADRLINDLKKVDWPESTKINQINWIGRSVGVEIDFKLNESDKIVKAFTTRVDTVYGVTYLALSPEHPLADKVATQEYKADVDKYINSTKSKTELERTSDKNKTGVLTGSYVINPFNKKKIPVWICDYVLMGYGTGAVMGVPAHDERDFEFAKKYNLDIVKVVENKKAKESDKCEDNLPYTHKDGVLINSDIFNGLTVSESLEKIADYGESNGFVKKKINYKLRDWLISRQRYWGAPIPIMYDKESNPISVDIEDLPVILPDDVEFNPTGVSPLVDHVEFHSIDKKKYPEAVKRESDTMDTFVDSSWYFFRFCDPNNEKEFASENKMKAWGPVDVYVGGAEHSVLHLMYARFFTKVLYDEGYIDFDEPFISLRHPGMILGEDSRKMSKRWGNVIDPLEVIEQMGADTLRMYEMFMGPFDQSKPWNTSTIQGVRRFLERVYKLKDIITDNENNNAESELNKLIKKVSSDIESFKFNTAVAEFMKFINFVEKEGSLSNSQLQRFLIVLSPFAPFITDELWQELCTSASKENNSIHLQKWPEYDESKIKDSKIKIGVQVNGKLRSDIELDIDTEEEKVKEAVINDQAIAKWIEDKEIKKFIYIKGKIVNIVV